MPIIDKQNQKRHLTGGFVIALITMGKGHNGAQPTVADVLDCIASDAAGVEGVTFEDWANDLGYDTDSRKALKTYNVCVRQMRSLGRLLGADAYADLLWNTVRL